MNAAEIARFDELLSRYLDDALSEAEAAELVALVADSGLAIRFLELTRLNSEIAGLLAAPVPDAAMVELVRTDIQKALAGERTGGGVPLPFLEQPHPPASPPPVIPMPRQKPRHNRFARRALAWAAVFFLLAGLGAVLLVTLTRSEDVSTVASIEGEVRLLGTAGERWLTSGKSWPRDQKLETIGPNSATTVRFRDGSQLVFSGNTVAVNATSQDGYRVELERGSVQGTLKKQPAQRPFVLTTPEAEAIVVGTTFRLMASVHHTRLEVTKGEVRFRRRHDGAEVAVKAGHYALVAPNVPFVATPFHPDPHAVH